MLSSDITSRILKPNDTLALRMLNGSNQQNFVFKIVNSEFPDDLADYYIGAASALNVSGTGWQEITDNSSRYMLEPEFENIVYQIYMGIAPGQARIYRRYPSNKDINSLTGTRPIGPPSVASGLSATGIGFISGSVSPYRQPSILSELFALKGVHPSFLGYHPYAEPSSINVYLYFYVIKYSVQYLGVDFPTATAFRSVGGLIPVDIPAWVRQAAGIS